MLWSEGGIVILEMLRWDVAIRRLGNTGLHEHTKAKHEKLS